MKKYQNTKHIRECLKIINRYVRTSALRVVIRSNILQQAENDMKIWNEMNEDGAAYTTDQKDVYHVNSELIWGNTYAVLKTLFTRRHQDDVNYYLDNIESLEGDPEKIRKVKQF